MGAIRQLYELQVLDGEREEQLRRLAEINAKLDDLTELDRAREAVRQAEADVDKLRVSLRALELEIDGLNVKLRQNQERLYSGRVKNPKELSGLEDEAGALRRRRSELEDDQLELMIEVEEEEAELSERQARRRQIEATRDRDVVRWQEEAGELARQIEELDGSCEEIRTYLGAADLAMYGDLRGRLGGTAVVILKKGICQACGVDVPTGMAYAVERGEGAHLCPTCGRLLYGGG